MKYYMFSLVFLLTQVNSVQIYAQMDSSAIEDSSNILSEEVDNEYSLQLMKIMIMNNEIMPVDNYEYEEYKLILSEGDADKDFSNFDKSLKLALAHDYKMRTRYDLGKAGYYLGMSKSTFAIILAIISL